eukprot:jgi/Chrzof1/15113/Cz09g27220.t1
MQRICILAACLAGLLHLSVCCKPVTPFNCVGHPAFEVILKTQYKHVAPHGDQTADVSQAGLGGEGNAQQQHSTAEGGASAVDKPVMNVTEEETESKISIKVEGDQNKVSVTAEADQHISVLSMKCEAAHDQSNVGTQPTAAVPAATSTCAGHAATPAVTTAEGHGITAEPGTTTLDSGAGATAIMGMDRQCTVEEGEILPSADSLRQTEESSKPGKVSSPEQAHMADAGVNGCSPHITAQAAETGVASSVEVVASFSSAKYASEAGTAAVAAATSISTCCTVSAAAVADDHCLTPAAKRQAVSNNGDQSAAMHRVPGGSAAAVLAAIGATAQYGVNVSLPSAAGQAACSAGTAVTPCGVGSKRRRDEGQSSAEGPSTPSPPMSPLPASTESPHGSAH